MDDAEWRLEKLGYVRAFNDPGIIQAISDHPSVAITVVEWSYSQQEIVVPWRILDNPVSVALFASEVASIARVPMPANTSLRRAIAFSAQLLERAPFAAERKVIDISGDGPESFPPVFAPVQGDALQQGITINGLPIRGNNRYPKDIEAYYRDYVIGGPGAFYVVANGYDDFARAILKKLMLELVTDAATVPPISEMAHPLLRGTSNGCLSRACSRRRCGTAGESLPRTGSRQDTLALC